MTLCIDTPSRTAAVEPGWGASGGLCRRLGQAGCCAALQEHAAVCSECLGHSLEVVGAYALWGVGSRMMHTHNFVLITQSIIIPITVPMVCNHYAHA